MEAIFLVGGKGTRLHPLTLEIPKPMLKVAGVPFIAHQIGYAKEHGVTRIVMAISYKNEQFLEYLGDGSEFGVEVIHAIEDEPLGTGGAIRNASQFLRSGPQDPIAILNGDILSAHDMKAQVVLHKNVGADATLHLIHVADARPYGSVPTEDSGKIIDFVEKSDNPPTNFINAGCYIFTRSAIDAIPVGEVVSIERETFPGLLTAGRKLWAYKSESYWIDIGTPAAFLKASFDLISGHFQSPAFTYSPDKIYVDPRAQIGANTQIGLGSSIGSAEIGVNVLVEKSIIGDEAIIGSGARISASIIGDGVHVGEGSQLHGVVIAGAGVHLPPNSRQIGDIK